MFRLRLFAVTMLLGACGSEDDDYVDEPVVLRDDTFIIQEDERFYLEEVRSNDDNYTYGTIEIVDEPQHGDAIESYSNGSYLPAVGYFGVDRFSYTHAGQVANVDVKIVSDGIPYERTSQLDTLSADDLEIGDIDGDGAVDLVTCDPSSSSISILANRTTAPQQYAFTPHRFEGGYAPHAVALADLDGDGKLDVITAANDDGLVVLRNATTPSEIAFDAPIYVPASQALRVETLDADGDRKPDLAALDVAGHIRLRLNRSTPGRVVFAPEITIDAPPSSLELATGDFDGDSRDDFAVLSADPGILSIYLNATTGSVPAFARADRATGSDPISMFVADVDRDGRIDFGVLHERGAVWTYENRATGTERPSFDAAEVWALSPSWRVAPLDLDGEAGVDLFAATEGGPLEYLMHRDGDEFETVHPVVAAPGSFDSFDSFAFGEVTSIRGVDLDGAEPLEIVVGETHSWGGHGVGVHVLFGR